MPKIDFHENQLSVSKLMITAEDLGLGKEFVLKKVKKNYKYVNGKKTDEFIDTTITVADVNTLSRFDIHVQGYINITQEELENTDDIIRVEINPLHTFIRPYKIEYGVAKCKVITEMISII